MSFSNSSEIKKRKLSASKALCWLCCSASHLDKFPPTIKFHAVFQHRVSALLYAYCICDKVKDLNPRYIQLQIETEDPNSKQLSRRDRKRRSRSFRQLYGSHYDEGVRSIAHFNGSYDDKGVISTVQVIPVLMDAEVGTHVEVFTDFYRYKHERLEDGYKHLLIERIIRVNILESQNYAIGKIVRDGKKSFVKGRYECEYVSTLISCPKHLLESDNAEKNIDTNYLSVIESLYPLDIVSKLGTIISVIFLEAGLHQSYLPLYCVDRIVSFLSIEDVLRLLHYGLPSKNDFDSQRLKEDIFCSLPKSLISFPFEILYHRAEPEFISDHPGYYDWDGYDESSVIKKSSEEFWILFNESMDNPHSYLKNDIKVNGIFRPLFVIPIEYQKGYIRNSILRIRSFLLKKSALHLVENEAIKIQTISRIEDGLGGVSFSSTLIQAIFTDHGSRCSWFYSAVDKQSPKLRRRLKNVDWDENVLYIRYPCRRQIIMLTEESGGEDINESPCEISRVENCLPCIKTSYSQINIQCTTSTESESDILQGDADELRYIPCAGLAEYGIKDPYEPYRVRLIRYLTENFEGICSSYRSSGAKFNPLPELWRLLADAFGISNYSIIKSEDEITPAPTQNDLVVISFRGDENSIETRLRLVSAHCFRNYKSSISSSIASADDDETPCVQLNVLQLLWNKKLRLWSRKAKLDISRSGRLLHFCGVGGSSLRYAKAIPFNFSADRFVWSHIFQLIVLLMPLKCRPVQVWFPELDAMSAKAHQEEMSADSDNSDYDMSFDSSMDEQWY